ncbi:MAG: hypothetical protein HUJ68_01285, partial [Clostridia bacterium]|nr:hypothetical protein [Clostridia bacterium]
MTNTKIRSAYTIRKKDTTVNGGAIYENDITTFENFFTDSDEFKTFAEGNFIVVVKKNDYKKREISTNKWDGNPETNYFYTLEDIT